MAPCAAGVSTVQTGIVVGVAIEMGGVVDLLAVWALRFRATSCEEDGAAASSPHG